MAIVLNGAQNELTYTLGGFFSDVKSNIHPKDFVRKLAVFGRERLVLNAGKFLQMGLWLIF